jgi:hypothetical protein
MKIACISYFLPKKENNQGPNSLIYQIIACRNQAISIDLYLPINILAEAGIKEINEIERELNLKILSLRAIQPTLLQRLRSSWWPTGAKLNYQIDDILKEDYGLVWGYPFWTAPYVKQIPAIKVISGMDSVTLLYFRKVKTCIVDRSWQVFKYLPALIRYFLFESIYLRHCKVHVVGSHDQAILKMLGVDSFYVPHPINPIKIKDNDVISTKSVTRIRILVSNAFDSFYGSSTVYQWLKVILSLSTKFADTEFEIIFHKGNTQRIKECITSLKLPDQVKLTFVGWINDYESFLLTINIQIFPLDIGAGTKTSVLTALYMNVICVGTNIACENIDTLPSPQYLLRAETTDEFASQFMVAMTYVKKWSNQPLGYLLAPAHCPTISVNNFWNNIIP